MQSALFRCVLILSATLALSACSKDGGSPQVAKQSLFKSRYLVEPSDDFALDKDKGDAIPTGLASNTNTSIWACGYIKSTGPTRAIVRQSVSAGVKGTWVISSDTTGPTNEGATNSAIATDGNGNVYVAQTYTSGKSSVASILYSNDGGLTWKNADYETPNLKSSLNSVTVSPNGVPYFTGVSEDKAQLKQGFILTLENEKAVLLTSYNNSVLNQVAALANGAYSAVGLDLAAGSSQGFLLSGVSDLTNSFRELDLPTIRPLGKPALGNAKVIMISDGVTYTGGIDKDANWIIKKSSNGVNFKTADKFNAGFSDISITGLYNYMGLPFAIGGGRNSEGHSHWIVRYAEADGVWRPFLSFNEAKDEHISAKAVGIASVVQNTQLAILGVSHDADTGYHWKMIRVSERQFSTKH